MLNQALIIFFYLRAITKTAVSSELRTEVEENQKVLTTLKILNFFLCILLLSLPLPSFCLFVCLFVFLRQGLTIFLGQLQTPFLLPQPPMHWDYRPVPP
jgi:hypothetical protein